MNVSLKVSMEGDSSCEMSFTLEPLHEAVQSGTWNKQQQSGLGVDPSSGDWSYWDSEGEIRLSQSNDVFAGITCQQRLVLERAARWQHGHGPGLALEDDPRGRQRPLLDGGERLARQALRGRDQTRRHVRLCWASGPRPKAGAPGPLKAGVCSRLSMTSSMLSFATLRACSSTPNWCAISAFVVWSRYA